MQVKLISSYQKSSSIEVVFPGGRLPSSPNFENCWELYLIRPSNVTKKVELISCLFTTIPGGWAASRAAGGIKNKAQPSLAGTGAELGNKIYYLQSCLNSPKKELFKGHENVP